jgi:penicillin-binding protein A
MNSAIMKLFVVVLVLFGLLIGWTSRWTVFSASSLTSNPLNRRTLVDDLRIKRGKILADDGAVLAKSVPAPAHTWRRTYPTGTLFAQAVGYLDALEGQVAGLEESRELALRGLQTGLSSIFGQLSPNPVGDDVYTTLDPKAQRVAEEALAGRAGSVVALDPQTGAVKVMYANPGYNSNDPHACTQKGCELNRSTQGQYPPGSTFKVVTATAAIDSGKYTPDSVVNGNSPVTISGVPLSNDGDQSFGPISLTTALTYSVNTVWAQVAESLGRPTMTKYMKRFGFYAKPPLDYPPGQINESRPFAPNGRPYPPGSPNEDIGRIAIGQGGLLVTPLQMAMVAAAVANKGKLMKPQIWSRVVNVDGSVTKRMDPSVYGEPIKPKTAEELTTAMEGVVDEGTGTSAAIPGVPVAGKTGTAETPGNKACGGGEEENQAWFIGFAPADHPKIAIAASVECTEEFGGDVAAPIFREVAEAILNGE